MVWRATPFSGGVQYPDAVPGQVVEVFYNGKFVVRTGDGYVLVHEHDLDDPRQLEPGPVLRRVDFRKVIAGIESRYPPFVRDDQKEITLPAMETFYSRPADHG